MYNPVIILFFSFILSGNQASATVFRVRRSSASLILSPFQDPVVHNIQCLGFVDPVLPRYTGPSVSWSSWNIVAKPEA